MRIVFDLDERTNQLVVTIGARRLSEVDGWRLMWAMEPVLDGTYDDDPNDYTIATAQRRHIERVLGTFSHLSYGQVAKLLGISKKTLWSYRKDYRIETPGSGKHRQTLLQQQHLSTSPAE